MFIFNYQNLVLEPCMTSLAESKLEIGLLRHVGMLATPIAPTPIAPDVVFVDKLPMDSWQIDKCTLDA